VDENINNGDRSGAKFCSKSVLTSLNVSTKGSTPIRKVRRSRQSQGKIVAPSMMKTAAVGEDDLFRSLDNITTHNENQELDIECEFNE
jgi:hypothetical protein